eukprot:snap_masked-scaffold_2-processed-gene-13.35-mRNA-1 protein AED:0.46 eAED:0.46 QI:0/-1/0/1/-1/1/1/0/85
MRITRIFAWGDGSKGQLGLGHMESSKVPTEIELDNICGEVVACGAGESHSAILTAKGRVYTFGAAVLRELGHEDEINKNKPTLLK